MTNDGTVRACRWGERSKMSYNLQGILGTVLLDINTSNEHIVSAIQINIRFRRINFFGKFRVGFGSQVSRRFRHQRFGGKLLVPVLPARSFLYSHLISTPFMLTRT